MGKAIEVPDAEICRTRYDSGNFWECLVDYDEYAYTCAYVIGINSRHFCMHHDCRNFELER